MSLFTSSQFASAAASGADWREAAKAVLEKLESIQTEGKAFNLGFIYITDKLSDDAESILNLFKSVLGIEHWVGANGVGICAPGESFIDEPAISAMIGQFDEDAFCTFPADSGEMVETLGAWKREHDPMLVIAHGDPMAKEDPAITIQSLNNTIPGFMVGGLSSSRNTQVQIADEIQEDGVSGVVFESSIAVSTILSQGCEPIGDVHTITRSDEHTILELDDEKAVGVFERNIRDVALRKVGSDPDEILVDELDIESVEDMPQEFHGLLKGDFHVAFPVSESDQNDYLVRNIMGLDPDEGSITVAQYLSNGERVMFVHRDENTVRKDLSESLVKLRKRATDSSGHFEPKGALYISCAGRAQAEFEDNAESEMTLIRDIIGDVPLVGLYAGGEISNARLYGYTGILTLFL